MDEVSRGHGKRGTGIDTSPPRLLPLQLHRLSEWLRVLFLWTVSVLICLAVNALPYGMHELSTCGQVDTSYRTAQGLKYQHPHFEMLLTLG